MKTTFEELLAELKKRKIRLSHQRLKVLEYLVYNRTHPTADEIYHGLQREIPTLSKTTVYNALGVLEKAGMVRVINIDAHEARYDIVTDGHGHFRCEDCGVICDFDIDIGRFSAGDLNECEILQKDVYFKGICMECRKKRESQA